MAIQSFRHKGLERFFTTGTRAGIRPEHVKRLRVILARLNVAEGPHDLELPGLRPHPLHGEYAGRWSVSVSGNWRITFRFDGKNPTEIDYEDYH